MFNLGQEKMQLIFQSQNLHQEKEAARVLVFVTSIGPCCRFANLVQAPVKMVLHDEKLLFQPPVLMACQFAVFNPEHFYPVNANSFPQTAPAGLLPL